MAEFILQFGWKGTGEKREIALRYFVGTLERMEPIGDTFYVPEAALEALKGGVEVLDCLPRTDVGPKHRCGSGNRDRWQGVDQDSWHRIGPDRVCSYCGSIHPDDLAALLDAPDVQFEAATNKSYKLYVHRDWIINAGMGGIKFYTWHADEALIAKINARLVQPRG